MPSINSDEVRHIAKLAKLSLSENEIEQYSKQLGEILEYVEKLNEINTDGIEPTVQPFASSNHFREDANVSSLSQRESLSNAPESSSNNFQIPKVIR